MLIWCAARAAIVLFVGLVVYAAMGRTSAAARRAVLVAALGASLAVPLLALVGPRVEAPVIFGEAHESMLEGGSAGVVGPGIVAAVPASDPPFDPAPLLVAVWLAGAVALLGRTALSQLRAHRLARTGERLQHNVRICDGIDSPVVTGLFRSVVLLPRDAQTWTGKRIQMVLTHERAHVYRRDNLAQLIADVACALHWFDPLAWLVAARLRVEREHAADDSVLASGVRASSYAEVLLAVAGTRTAGALAMAERTTLGTRIVAILASQRARGPLGRRGTAALIAGTLGLGAAIACAAPASQASTKPTDAHAQAAAEATVTALRTQWSGEAAVAIVLDVATGEILANAGDLGAIVTGSTLKPFTIAAALDSGAITASQHISCGPEPRRYGAEVLKDSSPNGTLDVAHLLAVSSNIGLSHIFDALGGDPFATYLQRAGLTDRKISAEAGTLAGARVANGEALAVTPLALARAYAKLANGEVGSATTTKQVMAMLETAVVDPTATGQAARVAGIHVAGKTGTADLPDHRTYASFVGIADLPKRRVVVLVGVVTRRDEVSGGHTAAPAFAELIKQL